MVPTSADQMDRLAQTKHIRRGRHVPDRPGLDPILDGIRHRQRPNVRDIRRQVALCAGQALEGLLRLRGPEVAEDDVRETRALGLVGPAQESVFGLDVAVHVGDETGFLPVAARSRVPVQAAVQVREGLGEGDEDVQREGLWGCVL